MNDKQFKKAVLEYVELTDSLLSRPALKKDVLQKTASALVDAKLIKPTESKVLIESFNRDPNRALEVLQKVAERYKAETSEIRTSSIGSPVGDIRTPKQTMRPSDRLFMERFHLI
jgi:hypothetical protein